eukprot:3488072-Pyramimonas_sp.AAC.1
MHTYTALACAHGSRMYMHMHAHLHVHMHSSRMYMRRHVEGSPGPGAPDQDPLLHRGPRPLLELGYFIFFMIRAPCPVFKAPLGKAR